MAPVPIRLEYQSLLDLFQDPQVLAHLLQYCLWHAPEINNKILLKNIQSIEKWTFKIKYQLKIIKIMFQCNILIKNNINCKKKLLLILTYSF